MSMIKAVFDTNVVLQAILSDKGPARSCVKSVLEGRVKIVTSPEIIKEVLGVISRPSLRRKYPQLRDPSAQEIVTEIFAKAILNPHPRRTFKLDRDKADEVFINLALESSADYLVTRDRDMLDLQDDGVFCEMFADLKIVTPVGFLEQVRSIFS